MSTMLFCAPCGILCVHNELCVCCTSNRFLYVNNSATILWLWTSSLVPSAGEQKAFKKTQKKTGEGYCWDVTTVLISASSQNPGNFKTFKPGHRQYSQGVRLWYVRIFWPMLVRTLAPLAGYHKPLMILWCD